MDNNPFGIPPMKDFNVRGHRESAVANYEKFKLPLDLFQGLFYISLGNIAQTKLETSIRSDPKLTAILLFTAIAGLTLWLLIRFSFSLTDLILIGVSRVLPGALHERRWAYMAVLILVIIALIGAQFVITTEAKSVLF